jgi:hypothetical protein
MDDEAKLEKACFIYSSNCFVAGGGSSISTWTTAAVIVSVVLSGNHVIRGKRNRRRSRASRTQRCRRWHSSRRAAAKLNPSKTRCSLALAGRPHRLASKRRFRRLPNKPHINKWFPCALCVDPSITSSGNFTFSGDEEHQSSLFKITFSALWVSRK